MKSYDYRSKQNIFRAYDIRGIYGKDLNESVARQIGRAYGTYLGGQGKVALGRDIRESSEALSGSIGDGIIQSGVDLVDIGIVPSPVLYFTVRNKGLRGGIMTTGSHLPPEWNGFKICDNEGIVISEDMGLEDIKEVFLEGKNPSIYAGKKSRTSSAINDYIEYITSLVSICRTIKITMDYGNSVTAMVVPKLLRKVGVEPNEISKELNSANPDRDSEPSEESLSNLKEAVLANGSELGIAYDGDGDRVAFVDETGKAQWSGNTTIPIFAEYYLDKENRGKVVFDVTCSSAVANYIRSLGGEPVEIRVGSGFCAEMVRKSGALFGGQYSGHTSFPEMGCTDDAIFASLKMLEIISQGVSLSTLVSKIPVYPVTAVKNIECSDALKSSVVEKVIRHAAASGYDVVKLDGAKIYDRNSGAWVLVRTSNTSPLIRVNGEGKTYAEAVRMQNLGEKMVQEAMFPD